MRGPEKNHPPGKGKGVGEARMNRGRVDGAEGMDKIGFTTVGAAAWQARKKGGRAMDPSGRDGGGGLKMAYMVLSDG